MKAVILEINNGFAAVLSDDGIITKVKNKNYEIGQVITMKKQKVHMTKKLALGAASAAVLFLASGLGVWAYTSPYSYVSLDVNPSIEYTVNRFDLVIDVKAVNDGGEEILGQINLNNLNNKTISNAITTTIDQIADSGYFNGTAYEPVTAVSGGTIIVTDNDDATNEYTVNTGGIIITTSSENKKKSKDLAQKLEETATEAVDKTGDEVEVEVVSVGYERVQRARELGVTPGKLNLVEKLQASAKDPESIDIEEWLNKPVKDIMKAIKDNKKGLAVDETDETENETTKTTETLEHTATTEKDTKQDEANKEEKKAEKAQQKATDKAAKVEKTKAKAEVKIEKTEAKAEKKSENAKAKAETKIEKTEPKAVKKSDNTKAKAEIKIEKTEAKAEEKINKTTEKVEQKTESKSEKVKNNEKSETTDEEKEETTTTVSEDNEKSNNGIKKSENANNSNKKDDISNSTEKSNNGQISKGK